MKNEGQHSQAKRIMVINDEQELLKLFRAILEEEGYKVYLYSYAIEDMQEIEQIKPDLIILDILLGNKQNTGWTILQKLKLSRSTASIPILICTAALREVEEQQGYLAARGVTLILKPFGLDELIRAVEKAFLLP